MTLPRKMTAASPPSSMGKGLKKKREKRRKSQWITTIKDHPCQMCKGAGQLRTEKKVTIELPNSAKTFEIIMCPQCNGHGFVRQEVLPPKRRKQ